MPQELVSVVIACYNAKSYIDTCLESLVNQNHKNIEIIVCDDASTDDSWLILTRWQEKDKRIKLLKNAKNLFQASARNSCINIASGKYIMIQDIDDISPANRIEVLLSNILIHQVDFVSSEMATIGDDGLVNFNYILKHKKRFPSKYDFLWNVPFNHPASMFLANSLKRVDGYRVSKETRRNEDYDLYMRLYANGARGMNIDQPLYIYRYDTATIKRRTFSARIDECIVRYKGFKLLKILHFGLPFVIKPIIAFIAKDIIHIR
jgi:glycosyltransferase involved in cell wall biosynthesis